MAAKKIILVTGVTRGLGLAMAAEFIRLGHTLIGCGRDATTIAELKARYPGPHLFSSLDVRNTQQVDEWAAEVLARLGPPDLLVNNAALVNQNAPLWEVSAEEFAAVIDVNLKGVANVLRAYLPAMLARGDGVIVNFSSGWGRSTAAMVAPYCASKWAIEGLTRALAQELPRGMAAIPLNPGIIDTGMLRCSFGAVAAAYPAPQAWAKVAVPMLLRLGPRDNGRPLTVEGY